jgi:glutathione reductase (NADPH)
VLVGAADLVDWRRRMTGHGIDGDARIDWTALMRFKRTFTGPVPSTREASFQKAGIATHHGAARFIGEDRLVVAGHELQAAHFVIASGAEPRRLDIPGERSRPTWWCTPPGVSRKRGSSISAWRT